jgi:hypothetical protein
MSRFTTAVAPFAIAAAFTAPVPEGFFRRSVSSLRESQTSAYEIVWTLDSWSYSEEPATTEEFLLLHSLLTLEASEGLVLDLTD